MSVDAIRYFDRYRKTIETEKVYGSGWLRWTYGTSLGQLALGAVVKRAFVSRYYGWRMARRFSVHKVLPFISDYDIDVDEFAKSPFAYKTFNEFFFRALKPAARPIAAGETVAAFPADGRHLAIPDVDAATGFYAKGQRFSLESFLGSEELARRFKGASILISRLCPVDYHRFHFPVDGKPGEAVLINGWLYSVNPIALRRNLRYLWENKRMLTVIESRHFGTVLMVEIGATMVGSILQTYVPGRDARKGDEKGLFKFGGSCVVTLFERGRIRFDADLLEHSANQTEIYARMGDRLGEAL